MKATLGSLSAQSTITVYSPGPDGKLPPGIVQWTVAPLSGFAPSSAVNMRLVNSTDFSKPDLFSLEADTTTQRSFILRGLTSDGQQMWQSQPISDVVNIIPSASGDAIILKRVQSNTTEISKIVAGQQVWSYAPADVFAFSQNPAIRSDGVMFAVEGDNNGGAPTSRVIGLNETAGSILSQFQLPVSTLTYQGSNPANVPGNAGPLMVAQDGSVYVEFYNYNETANGPVPNTVYNVTYNLNLVHIDPAGNGTLQLLHSGGYVNSVGLTNGDYVYPGEVIPDGQGGVLAGWELLVFNGATSTGSAELSHVTSAGGIVQYTLPFNGSGWCGGIGGCPLGGPANSMVVGEHNTAFATNGDRLIALDVNSGIPKWFQQSPSGEMIALVAATADGGVTVKETDQNGNENVVSFDSTGTPTQDVTPAGTTGIVYYAGEKWVAVVGRRATAYKGDAVYEAPTTWPDSPVFRVEVTVLVNNFSQTGPNQTTIQNELQVLQTLIPSNTTCSNWLQQGPGGLAADAPHYIQLLLNGNQGQPMFGHGSFFEDDRTAAFTGNTEFLPQGILLTVNDNGGFFQSKDSLGNNFEVGPRKYEGGKQRARDAILIHEFAHGIEAAGFQPDLSKPWIGKENDKLVDDHCRKLIER